MRSLFRITFLLLAACAAATEARAQLSSRTYATGFTAPIAFIQDPTDARVQFVVEQDGLIRTVRSGTVLPTNFLNITSVVRNLGEQGLLGMAFAPDYATSGRFYVHFNREPDGKHVIARYRRSGDPLVADPSSRFDLKWGGPTGPPAIDQPGGNHNGGNIAFGPDGFLYIALGDAANGHLSQDPTVLNGKMLRIDVSVPDSSPQGYRVPPDNPFLDNVPIPALPEIWAFGFRNPWRWSFDDPARGGTGALVLGDVGSGAWEEIDYEPANRGGRNYGWSIREGAHPLNPFTPAYLPLVDPIHEYDHSAGSASVTGGFVYRGAALGAAYRGAYFFAEFVQGRIWSVALTINPMTGEATSSNLVDYTAELGGIATFGNITSFGVDLAGELYMVSYSGKVLKIVGPPVAPRVTWRNKSTGQDLVWMMNGSTITSAAFIATIADTNWEIKAGQDLNADRRLDLVWRNKATGQNILWLMNGSTINNAAFTSTIANTDWEIKGSGDLNSDGTADLIWRNRTSGQNIAWLMNGMSIASAVFVPTIANLDWEISGLGDLNGDGRADVIWRNTTNGLNIAWLMNGTTIATAAMLAAEGDVNWEIKGVGDLNGDGLADLIWRNKSTGANKAWQMNGLTTLASSALAAIADVNWEIRQVSDMNANGKADIVWRNKFNGQDTMWLMDGFVEAAAALPTIAELNWEIASP